MDTGRRAEYLDAEYWDQLVQNDPRSALVVAQRLVEHDDDRRAVALARAAASRSLFEIGSLTEALRGARAALRDLDGVGLAYAAPVTLSATAIIAEAGFVDEALDGLHRLAPQVSGVERGRVQLQIAYVLMNAGRLTDSLAGFDRSERWFRGEHAPRDRARLHLNRGLVLLQQGRLNEASNDFDAAESVAADAELRVVEALAVANRAVLLGRARQLARSLAEFDRAHRLFATSGSPDRLIAIAAIDRAEVMMHSGLLVDAVVASRSAVELVEPSGNAMLIGDAWLMLARAELAAGHTRAARSAAAHAARTLADADRTQMVAHAKSLVVQAELAAAKSADAASASIVAAVEVTNELRTHGWNTLADELAIVRVRTARRWGRVHDVRGDVERLRSGLVDGRRDSLISGWWAEAIARDRDGDRMGAVAACHEGLGVLDEIVAEAPTLGDRSAAMRIGRDLSMSLIEFAVAAGDADTVLAAAEGTRARALHEELADPGRHRPLTFEGADRLRHELSARLDSRSLVEWLVLDDRIWAVVYSGSASVLVDVADRRTVVRAADRVTMWLDIAVAEPDGSSDRAMSALKHLDDVLLAPLGLDATDGVVIVPTGALHAIPWAGLPSLAGRSVTLAPNAQLWLEADRRGARSMRSVGIVVGPDVSGEGHERGAVDRAYSGVTLAAGDGAVASSVRAMFAGVDLVHLAAHGTFRSDHPLLSTIQLADGEATMYDVVPDRVHTQLVILSSCEGGAQGTADGSEVLGLSSVLLARGAASVVAPLTAVRELECAEFVADVHAELAGGSPIAAALATVRTRWMADDDLSRWAVASSFTCFGSGAVTVATPT